MANRGAPLRCARLWLVLAFAPAGAQAQAGRALGIEDYYRIRQIGSPVISPDGNQVAFTVSRRIEATNSDSSEIWVVATSGSVPASRVSRPGENARNFAWSDEGNLRYSAGTSAAIVDPARGNARADAAVTRVTGTPSPDGRWIVYTRNLPAPRRDPVYESEFEKRHQERFRGATFDWLAFQRDGAAFPVPDPRDATSNPPSEIFVRSTGRDDDRQLTMLGLQPRDVSWVRKGSALVFLADSLYRDELRYPRADLWHVNLNGQVQRLTKDERFQHSSLRVSPDGETIAFLRSWSTNYIIRDKLNHGGPTDIWVMPASGGAARNLTEDWPLQPAAPIWSPDGSWIYFAAETGGARHLFRVAAGGGPVQQVTTGDRRLGDLTFDREFKRMAFTVGRFEAPPEIHVANLDGSDERQLTGINTAFTNEVALSRAERVRFTSTDGTPIEGWLMLPYGYRPDGGPWPLIVSSHGGPHSASGYDFDFKLQYFAANGYFVLETNFRSSTGYGDDFLWATWGAWGTRDGQDIMAGIDHVIANWPIDRNRVGHIGHSYGGFLTNWLITQYPDRFAAAIAGAGISNWVSDYGTADIARTKETEFFGTPWDARARELMIRQSPLTYADRVRTPTLFIHGEVDQRVPYEEAEQMYTALKKRGVPAKMIMYADMPHGIRGHWNTVHRMLNELRWWNAWLRPTT
jgi:dipeptidyl aminopeptidase/acylaminoacyl peptidase